LRMSARRTILSGSVRERLTYDLRPLRAPAAWTIWIAARLLLSAPSPRLRARGFALLTRLHSGGFSPAVDRVVIDVIRDAVATERGGRDTGLGVLCDRQIHDAVAAFRGGTNPDPTCLIGSRMLVVKTWRPGERGVLVVDYTYVFPLLAGLFDVAKIAERYVIVLEPSWSDSCTPELLPFTRFEFPVLVQTIEPRDHDLFERLAGNCSCVPIAPNWWVDHRIMRPRPGGERDIDVIMVAAWANFKRHWRFFRVLADLRRRGHRLKIALVGYQGDLSKGTIEDQARYFGVHDQLELFERVPADQVGTLLSRSKVHVLWSRREGANRAIIEAMLAGVPVIVRNGLTYGYRYPYINPQTGQFVAEAGLGDAILEMIAERDRYAPREWVLEHMTAEKATAILQDRVREQTFAMGEPWTEGLVVKTSTLDAQQYWNPDDRSRFDADYAFLESALISPKAER
jgi:glycosyltransferase involved in cell wall biosynthesis